jgi:hypothetical protein
VDRTHTVQAVIVTRTDHDFVDVTVAPAKQSATPGRLARVALATAAGIAAATAMVQGGTLTTTYHHPFYDRTRATFVDAQDLRVGDELQTPDGGTTTVTALRLYHATEVTYDLTIDGLHTYYVVAGDTPVLVHNCGITSNNSPGTLADEQAAAQAAGVTPLRAGTPEFNDAVAGGGRHIWSVSEDGTLNIAKWGENIKHPILNGGAPVKGAGEVVFGRGGLVTDINNATGHYTPTCGCGADLQAGVDAFNNAGVPVLRGAIKAFGW